MKYVVQGLTVAIVLTGLITGYIYIFDKATMYAQAAKDCMAVYDMSNCIDRNIKNTH